MRGDKERGMMKSKLKGGSEASLVRLVVRVEGGNRGNTVGSRMRMRDRIPIEDFPSPTQTGSPQLRSRFVIDMVW